MLSEGQQGDCPDFYYPLKQAQGVAEFMRCTVAEALKLAETDGELFNNVLIAIRAEKLVTQQRERERGRHG